MELSEKINFGWQESCALGCVLCLFCLVILLPGLAREPIIR